MIYLLTCLALLSKKKIPIFLCIFLINIFYFIANAQSIFPIIRINKEIITNIDLDNEIKIISMQYKNIDNKTILKNQAIKNLIEDKIKEIEVNNSQININLENINKKVNSLLEIYKVKTNYPNQVLKIKKILTNKVTINSKWSRLIEIKYFNDINLNTNELNEISNKKRLNAKEKENFVLSEKIKKLEKYSRSHFNDVKIKYIVKIL